MSYIDIYLSEETEGYVIYDVFNGGKYLCDWAMNCPSAIVNSWDDLTDRERMLVIALTKRNLP